MVRYLDINQRDSSLADVPRQFPPRAFVESHLDGTVRLLPAPVRQEPIDHDGGYGALLLPDSRMPAASSRLASWLASLWRYLRMIYASVAGLYLFCTVVGMRLPKTALSPAVLRGLPDGSRSIGNS